MKTLSHLSDQALASGLASAAARERASTAELISYIAEFDRRQLYRGAGYASMHLYCERKLHLSADAAYKRITTARVARDFPVILEALADGRLNVTMVNLLSPHLSQENADALFEQAFHKTKS